MSTDTVKNKKGPQPGRNRQSFAAAVESTLTVHADALRTLAQYGKGNIVRRSEPDTDDQQAIDQNELDVAK